jgi:hypothetical protein
VSVEAYENWTRVSGRASVAALEVSKTTQTFDLDSPMNKTRHLVALFSAILHPRICGPRIIESGLVLDGLALMPVRIKAR